ncbi:MAG: hypothetical protein V1836_00600 [Candidatus Aenigmatarchaeota archaeon]
MNEMARLLGKYQRPVLALDTSTLVSLGQNDIATISALSRLDRELMHASGYEVVVLEHVAKEYARFYDESVLGDFGIPKASLNVLESLGYSRFPDHLRTRIIDAQKLWKEASPKSPKNIGLQSDSQNNGHVNYALRRLSVLPSRSDQELLAFTLEQAENSRQCYVFSRDEDIIGPVKNLSKKYPCIHYVGYGVERPSLLSGKRKPVLITPEVAGTLYNLEQNEPLENYLLSAKVPFAGEIVDMMVSVHRVEGAININEKEASRHLLNVSDIDSLAGVSGYKKDMISERENAKLKSAARRINNKYAALSFVSVSRTRSGGLLRIAEVNRKVRFTSNGLVNDVETPDLEWFIAYPSYLREFSSETSDYLAGFKREFSR